MRKNRSYIFAMCLSMLLVASMACSRVENKVESPTLEDHDLVLNQVLEAVQPKVRLVSSSKEKIDWKGEKPYPYPLTMYQWKEEYEVDSLYGPVHASFNVKYPSISGMKDTAIEEKINQLIYDEIKSIVEEYFPVSPDFDMGISLERDCIITLMTEDYLSIRFDGHTSFRRYSRSFDVITIDLKSGRKLELPDFFDLNAKPAELIMEYCKRDLKSQYLEHYNEPIGEQFSMLIDWSVTPETCSKVNLTQKGFYLIFDELFSKAEGRWTVLVPYEAFGDKCKLRAISSLGV